MVTASDLDDAQKRVLAIAYNRLAELADWDRETLATELKELGEADAHRITFIGRSKRAWWKLQSAERLEVARVRWNRSQGSNA